MTDAPMESQALLNQTRWLAGLVRHLVEDAEVDDVVQETIRRALARPPRRPSAARSFLAAIARNVVRTRRTADQRRERREAEAPTAEAHVPTLDVVERFERQRLVVDAVLELDEPHRRAILLRYFEALSPAEIATREGVPLDTAKSRLKRGLARIRSTLRRELGEEQGAWLLAILPLAFPNHPEPRSAWFWPALVVAITAALIALVYVAGQIAGWLYY